jgi:colanic acid biosynthesis glycosyl transferase WcaI
MRLLIVGLNFQPELTGIGKYTGEMAAYLSSSHQVRVVTTAPYYPYWQVQEGFTWWQYKREIWCGMRVYRCPLWVPCQPSGLKRLLHLFSFALSSFPVLLRQMFWKPDLVLCVAPALFSAPSAWFTARLSGSKAWLHIQDFELDAALNLSMLPSDHFLTRWAAHIESWLLARFDQVSTISNRMIQSLKNKGVPSKRTYLFPNWVDTNQIFPLPDSRKTLRQIFDLPEDKVIVLYSGNMGNKQGLEMVVDVAREIQTHDEIFFVFCGEGSARKDLETRATELPNVQFLSLQPAEKLNQLLNTADIHILPQRNDAADLVMPSKLLGMLASGKPVIATANPETEIGTVVGRNGVLVPPGDQQALYQAILELAQSLQRRSCLGQKGRAFVCQNWTREHILTVFELHLRELVEGDECLKESIDIKDARSLNLREEDWGISN